MSGSVSGNNLTITDSSYGPIVRTKINGITSQDGTPSPSTPIDITGLAEDGAFTVKTSGKNLFKITFTGSAVINGITYTALDNGTIKCNGYPETGTNFSNIAIGTIKLEKGKSYKVCNEKGSNVVSVRSSDFVTTYFYSNGTSGFDVYTLSLIISK